MSAIGTIPEQISLLEALDSIGETIIIADADYTVCWINTEACRLLNDVAPLYGLEDCSYMIGMRMDEFHENPSVQEKIMKNLKGPHRTRISIKGEIVTDIVITPIRNKQLSEEIVGYVVMLMDVTTQAEEQKRNEQLIRELSTPILNIWHNTIALPLIGQFDRERSDELIATVLTECVEKRQEYVLVDLSGLKNFEHEVHHQLQKLTDTLNLIGATCILTGISPTLAVSMVAMETKVRTFSTAKAGLEHIMALQQSKK